MKKNVEFYCTREGNTICPFTKTKCIKINRQILGACAFSHLQNETVICPRIFKKINFEEIISKRVLGTDSFLVLKEVKIGNNFIDQIIVDGKDNNNFCGVEIQALDTTGNIESLFGEKYKPFCVNWKTTIKTIQSQLLEKISIFKKNKKSIVLVIQDIFFQRMFSKKYCFDLNKEFHVLVLKYVDKTLSFVDLYSYTLDEYINEILDVNDYPLAKLVQEKIKQFVL